MENHSKLKNRLHPGDQRALWIEQNQSKEFGANSRMFWVGPRIKGITSRCVCEKSALSQVKEGGWEPRTWTQSLRPGQTRCGVGAGGQGRARVSLKESQDLTGRGPPGEEAAGLAREVQGGLRRDLRRDIHTSWELNRMEHQALQDTEEFPEAKSGKEPSRSREPDRPLSDG